jgi:hypothetical protein
VARRLRIVVDEEGFILGNKFLKRKNVHIFVVFNKSEQGEKVNVVVTDIVENAFLQLQEALGDAIQWGGRSKGAPGRSGFEAIFKLNGRPIHVARKGEVGYQQIGQLGAINHEGAALLVVARYIAPGAMEVLRSKGIHYLDAKGNMSLRMDQVIIFINGIANSPQPSHVRTRLFAKAGLQVVFWLLQDPANVNLSYRALADRANVALGNLPILFQALQEEGFLVKVNSKKWSLVERDRLLDLWVQEFGRRLKPAQLLGRFHASQEGFKQHWKDMALQDGAVWGGEPGADLLTDYLVPGEFTLYTDAARPEIMKHYRWAPHPTGNIAIYRKFWKDDPDLDQKAKPLLAYADLIGAGDPRGLEVAQMIHDKYLRYE